MLRSAVLIALALSGTAGAQSPVSPRHIGQRVLAIVPIVGNGTPANPRRPLFAPATLAEYRNPKGIQAFTWEPSDDGQFAIVEFRARDRAAFTQLLADPRVRAFRPGRNTRDEIERAIRLVRRNFRLENFGNPGRPQ